MCAIVGIAGHDEAAYLTYLGLHSLQHRGQESTGIVTTDGDKHFICRRRGMVSDVFTDEQIIKLKGSCAIGHNRYSTTGGDSESNIQPICVQSKSGWISIAHNGNLVNGKEIRDRLEEQGAIFQTTTDTEVILHLIARSKEPFKYAVVEALEQVEGAYSLLIMNNENIIAVRDPYGFRPLCFGYMKGYEKSSSGLVFASETCAFDLMNAKTVNEIQPGEMIAYDIKNGGWTSSTPLKKKTSSKCVFELIYFARPDSQIFNKQVYETRKALGRRLAQEQPAEADLVVPVPDSGIPAAIGYAEESKTPFESAIIRSHYIKRTFIQPQQAMRDLGVRLKLNAIRSCISGKRVVVVDDSLVRGTTSRKIISMLKECGARQIHFRISAPPTISPCFYGIDTPHKDQLIASKSSIEEIRQYIGADTIGYLSREGLSQVSGSGCCDACFSGDYPTLVQLSHK